ncbi:hypothetical protein N7471_001002 [Penicillium samsonianum]|uniref:uncharacterized protein n=1 Tax=Penicillium samsonianum TaxID=1882272 RepID=UPI0025473276|nr:uncharacterized protein N7471_001002 [Penicillium samsonianum]KAJ6149803.1 hypothetical protein N7471_001002 [Penicillium samsonianum]
MTSLLDGSRLTYAIFQVSSSGNLGNELRGMESVDRSNVPTLMIKYLTRLPTKILYSLSSLLDTSIESILENEVIWLIWAKARDR